MAIRPAKTQKKIAIGARMYTVQPPNSNFLFDHPNPASDAVRTYQDIRRHRSMRSR
jgi:hypothetical protein